jgi:hypothetical protein
MTASFHILSNSLFNSQTYKDAATQTTATCGYHGYSFTKRIKEENSRGAYKMLKLFSNIPFSLKEHCAFLVLL